MGVGKKRASPCGLPQGPLRHGRYNWTAVTSRFRMPAGPTPGAEPPFWWSMDHGLAHWVQLCSEFDLGQGSAQLRWLEADLAAARAGTSSWVVVTIHRPPYSSDHSWEDIRAELEPLLARYQVSFRCPSPVASCGWGG